MTGPPALQQARWSVVIKDFSVVVSLVLGTLPWSLGQGQWMELQRG